MRNTARSAAGRVWLKAHVMTGVKTNVISSVTISEGDSNDAPYFPKLVRKTAERFSVSEVSADKAYLNLGVVENVHATPYIPFKSNSGSSGSAAWERMWHLYALKRESFLRHYHQRSNVEATFSAVKRKFGECVRSRLPAAQFNEVLLKCLCHNLSMLVHSIHELGIDPEFWDGSLQ